MLIFSVSFQFYRMTPEGDPLCIDGVTHGAYISSKATKDGVDFAILGERFVRAHLLRTRESRLALNERAYLECKRCSCGALLPRVQAPLLRRFVSAPTRSSVGASPTLLPSGYVNSD